MTPLESSSCLQQLINKSCIGHAMPTPLVAWHQFKQFARERVACESDCLLFQAGDSEFPHDSYFDFCREYRLRDGETVWYEQVHAEFSAARPHLCGFGPVTVWSFDFETIGDFFAAVESLPEFQAGVHFENWSFRVYHTGV